MYFYMIIIRQQKNNTKMVKKSHEHETPNIQHSIKGLVNVSEKKTQSTQPKFTTGEGMKSKLRDKGTKRSRR